MPNAQPSVLPSHGPGRARVRAAAAADLPALLDLWQELREAGGRTARESLHVAVDDAKGRLTAALKDPSCRVVVAADDDGEEILGMAVLCLTSLGPLSALQAVQLNHVVVAKGHRKRGVGHALVAAAAAYADETGAEQVIVGVAPTLRDANRFYARLGFTPAVVRRVAPVAVLRRRLSAPEHPVAALEGLTRRRLITRPRRGSRRRLTAAGRTNT